MKRPRLPQGWTEKDVRELADYHDRQTDEEQLAEYEAAFATSGQTMVSVPTKLVPAVLKLIARHQKSA